jgi:hypothetical protein
MSNKTLTLISDVYKYQTLTEVDGTKLVRINWEMSNQRKNMLINILELQVHNIRVNHFIIQLSDIYLLI